MTSFSSPSSRWAALQRRDPLAASAFIYSVCTTKIYCRPTCPSRLARRANIVFHDTPAEAEAAGFRPCKRCRPNLRENEGDPQILAVDKACELIVREEIGAVKWSVKGLAKEVGLTESHFCRVFKKIMGMTIGEYRAKNSLLKSVDEFPQIVDAQKTTPHHLSPTYPNFAHEQETNIPELPTPSLCTSELLQDWQNFSGIQTPEGYFPDASDVVLASFYNPDLELSETWEAAEDCFQFVDFNSPWVAGIGQEGIM